MLLAEQGPPHVDPFRWWYRRSATAAAPQTVQQTVLAAHVASACVPLAGKGLDHRPPGVDEAASRHFAERQEPPRRPFPPPPPRLRVPQSARPRPQGRGPLPSRVAAASWVPCRVCAAREVAVPAGEVLTGHELLRLLGPVRDAGPLAPEIHEEVQCEGYTRRLVSYDVPSGRASAFVCIPEHPAGPAPLVFCHHQHAGEFDLGKSEACGLRGDPDQAYAAELAQRGFVTIAPDSSGSRTATGRTVERRLVRAVLPAGEGRHAAG